MTVEEQFAEAVSLVDKGRWEEALQALAPLAEAHPDLPAVQAKLGYVYWELADLARAIACFRRATQLAPHSEAASLGLFHSLWEDDQQEAALDEIGRFQAVADSEDYRNIIRELSATL